MSEKRSPPLGAPAVPGWDLVELKVLDADSSTVTFTGLDLDSARFYQLVMAASGTGIGGFDIYFNNDTTRTNYWSQILRAASDAVFGSRANDSYVGMLYAGHTLSRTLMITRGGTDRKPLISSDFGTQMGGDLIEASAFAIEWQSASNVTSIKFDTLSPFVKFRAGSRFALFKVSS